MSHVPKIRVREQFAEVKLETEPKRPKREPERYTSLFRVSHYVLAVAVPLLFVTGVSLHMIARGSDPTSGGTIPTWWLTGRVHLYHMVAALFFAPAVLCAAFGCYLSSESGKIMQRSSFLIMVVGGIFTLLTGYLLAQHPTFPFGYGLNRLAHAIFGLGLIPLAYVVHLGLALTKRRDLLRMSFQLNDFSAVWPAVLMMVGVGVVASVFLVDPLAWGRPARTIEAMWLTRILEPAFHSSPDEMKVFPWDQAEAIDVELINGSGFGDGTTTVTVRAICNDSDIYILLTWEDAAPDQSRRAWIRGANSWERMTTHEGDENVYYDDGIALAFPMNDSGLFSFSRFGCVTQCHAGGAASASEEDSSSFGYKMPREAVDVWLWRAAWAEASVPLDDRHAVVEESSNEQAGWSPDPSQLGGCWDNGPAQGGAHPAYLPQSLADVQGGAIPEEATTHYDEQVAAEYPEGTEIPGIVAAAFGGDRANVVAHAEYDNGHWNLWMTRPLETDSPNDVVFQLGQSYPVTCAAFDRSQARHAYHFQTFWIYLPTDGK